MIDLFYGTSGPRDARILLVGESWGVEELAKQAPFVGTSGFELTRLLREAGIDRNQVLLTNVCPRRPARNEMTEFFDRRDEARIDYRGLNPTPETFNDIQRLYALIDRVRPTVIIAFGNYAFWALTDTARLSYDSSSGRLIPGGITDYRGSMLHTHLDLPRIAVLPTIHPAALFRNWKQRTSVIHDLRRVHSAFRGNWVPRPEPVLEYRPTYDRIRTYLSALLARMDGGRELPLVLDVETKSRLVTCVGVAYSSKHALTIPLAKLTGHRKVESYWTIKEEAAIIRTLCSVLTHPKVRLIGQNFLYDMTYLLDHWGIVTRCHFDTMVAQHLLFPDLPKDLGYLSSLYCAHHIYWKDDNHEWDSKTDLDVHLRYNAEDCWRTFEIYEALSSLIKELKREEHWSFELEKLSLAWEMMRKGVAIDKKARANISFELAMSADARRAWLLRMVPQRLVDELFPSAKGAKRSSWLGSPAQQRQIFEGLFGLRIPFNRKTGTATLNREALDSFLVQAPYLRRIIEALLELRSLRVVKATFIDASLDPDGRMRCSFNPAGTSTFRWSSSTNPLGRGTNLQNIPTGKER